MNNRRDEPDNTDKQSDDRRIANLARGPDNSPDHSLPAVVLQGVRLAAC
jgi:hypothetical protein